jgi:hypothetical protein
MRVGGGERKERKTREKVDICKLEKPQERAGRVAQVVKMPA